MGPTGGLVVKNLPASAGDIEDKDSIPVLGRSPGRGNGNPLHLPGRYMDRGAWWATVHGIPKSRTQLSMHTCLKIFEYKGFWIDVCFHFLE